MCGTMTKVKQHSHCERQRGGKCGGVAEKAPTCCSSEVCGTFKWKRCHWGEKPYGRRGKNLDLAANYVQSSVSLNQNDIFPLHIDAVKTLLWSKQPVTTLIKPGQPQIHAFILVPDCNVKYIDICHALVYLTHIQVFCHKPYFVMLYLIARF